MTDSYHGNAMSKAPLDHASSPASTYAPTRARLVPRLVTGDGLRHWDGQRWSPYRQGLTHVPWFVRGRAANDVWLTQTLGFYAHWDGTGWCEAWAGTDRNLWEVWETDTDLWAVGEKAVLLRHPRQPTAPQP